MKKRKDMRNGLIIVLIMVMFAMTASYSILAQSTPTYALPTGYTKWNPEIEKIEIDNENTVINGIGNTSDANYMSSGKNGMLTAKLSARLLKLNDKVTYLITVKNNGDIPAIIDNIKTYYNNDSRIAVVVDSKKEEIVEDEMQTISVTVAYNEIIEIEDEVTVDVDVILNYIQK